MDIQKFINDGTNEMLATFEKNMKELQGQRSQLDHDLQVILHDDSIPEETDTLKVLTDYIGKQVRITSSRGVSSTEPLDFHPNDRVVWAAVDGTQVPLIGLDYIAEIYDPETQKTIYQNPYASKGYTIPLQKAKLFGKKEGLKAYEEEVLRLEAQESSYKTDLEYSLDAINHTNEFIERGKQVTYPQLHDAWEELVMHRVKDLTCAVEILHALEIMEALEAGKSIEEIKLHFSDILNENDLVTDMVIQIVASFSKRGVEFVKGVSKEYAHAVKNQYQQILDDVKKLEERNAKFDAGLGKGSLS